MTQKTDNIVLQQRYLKEARRTRARHSYLSVQLEEKESLTFERGKSPRSYDKSVDIWEERDYDMLKEERASDHAK